MQKFALSTSRARFAYTLSTPMYTPPPALCHYGTLCSSRPTVKAFVAPPF